MVITHHLIFPSKIRYINSRVWSKIPVRVTASICSISPGFQQFQLDISLNTSSIETLYRSMLLMCLMDFFLYLQQLCCSSTLNNSDLYKFSFQLSNRWQTNCLIQDMPESTCTKVSAFHYNDFPVLESPGNASVLQNLIVQDLYSYTRILQLVWLTPSGRIGLDYYPSFHFT